MIILVEEITAAPGFMPPSYCVINGQPAYIPWFNGMLEMQFFSIPIYFYIFIVLLMTIIGLVLYIVIHWFYMGPVWKYFSASWNKIDQAIYVGKQGRVTLEPMEYIGAAFRFIGAPLYFLQTSAGGLRFGGVNTMIVTDTVGLVKNPKLQVAMKTAITQWNLGEDATDEEIRAAVIRAKANKKYVPITDYNSLYNLAIKGKLLPDVIRIPTVSEVPVHELEIYLQDVDAGKLALTINKVAAELTKDTDPNKWIKITVVCAIVFAIIIVGAAIAGQVITGWK